MNKTQVARMLARKQKTQQKLKKDIPKDEVLKQIDDFEKLFKSLNTKGEGKR